MLAQDATAADLILHVFDHTRRRGPGVTGGFPADVLSVYFGERVECWFAGENDKVILWDISVAPSLRADLEARIPGVEFRAVSYHDRYVYRLTRPAKGAA